MLMLLWMRCMLLSAAVTHLHGSIVACSYLVLHASTTCMLYIDQIAMLPWAAPTSSCCHSCGSGARRRSYHNICCSMCHVCSHAHTQTQSTVCAVCLRRAPTV